MTKEEIRQVGEAGPTIDSIEIAEFESHAAIKEWVKQKGSGISAVKGLLAASQRKRQVIDAMGQSVCCICETVYLRIAERSLLPRRGILYVLAKPGYNEPRLFPVNDFEVVLVQHGIHPSRIPPVRSTSGP